MSIFYLQVSAKERIEEEIQSYIEYLENEQYIAANAAELAKEDALHKKELQYDLQKTFKAIETSYKNRCPKGTVKPDYASVRIERSCQKAKKKAKKMRRYVTANKKAIQATYVRSIRIARAS